MPLATTISGQQRVNRFNDISGTTPNLFFTTPISQISPVVQTYTTAGSNAVVVPYNTQFQRNPRYVQAQVVGGGGGGSGGAGGRYYTNTVGSTTTRYWVSGGGGGSGAPGAYVNTFIPYDYTIAPTAYVTVGAGGAGGAGGPAGVLAPSGAGSNGQESNFFIDETKMCVATGGGGGTIAGNPRNDNQGRAGQQGAYASNGRIISDSSTFRNGNTGINGAYRSSTVPINPEVNYPGGNGGQPVAGALINGSNWGNGNAGGKGGNSGTSIFISQNGATGADGDSGIVILTWYYQ